MRVPGQVLWRLLGPTHHHPNKYVCFGFACGVSRVDAFERGTLWCLMASSLAYDFSWYFGTAWTNSLGNFNNNNCIVNRCGSAIGCVTRGQVNASSNHHPTKSFWQPSVQLVTHELAMIDEHHRTPPILVGGGPISIAWLATARSARG